MFSTKLGGHKKYYVIALVLLLILIPELALSANTNHFGLSCSTQVSKVSTNISSSGFGGLSFDPGDYINQILCDYNRFSSKLAAKMAGNAKKILQTLYVIDTAWMGICWVIAQSDLAEMIPAYAKKIIMYMFLWALIDNAQQAAKSENIMDNQNWLATIPNSFAAVGQMIAEGNKNPDGTASIGDASLMRINPGQIFDDGIVMGLTFFGKLLTLLFNPGNFLIWNFLATFFVFIFGSCVAIAIVIMFSILAMDLFVNFVEAYITTAVGIFIFGLTGSRWTAGFLNVYVAYVIGLSIRIMMGITVYAISYDILDKSIKANTIFTSNPMFEPKHAWDYMGTVLGEVFVMFMVVKQVPQIAGGFMTNTSMMTAGSGLAATASLAKSTVGVIASTAPVLGGSMQKLGKELTGEAKDKDGKHANPQRAREAANAKPPEEGRRENVGAFLDKKVGKSAGKLARMAVGVASGVTKGFIKGRGVGKGKIVGAIKGSGGAIAGGTTALGRGLRGGKYDESLEGVTGKLANAGNIGSNLAGKAINNVGKALSSGGNLLNPKESKVGKWVDKTLGGVENSSFLKKDQSQIMAMSTISIEFPAED